MPATTYRLVSYQRPCHGTCETLDEPTDRCEAAIDVARDEVLNATVELHATGGCTIDVPGAAAGA